MNPEVELGGEYGAFRASGLMEQCLVKSPYVLIQVTASFRVVALSILRGILLSLTMERRAINSSKYWFIMIRLRCSLSFRVPLPLGEGAMEKSSSEVTRGLEILAGGEGEESSMVDDRFLPFLLEDIVESGKMMIESLVSTLTVVTEGSLEWTPPKPSYSC